MISPIDRIDEKDVGDTILRKFNYQHAYGVILSIRMVTEAEWGCRAIWCEQHEDLLAEFEGDFFDAYQVKTRRSELGYWKLNHEALLKSLKRFVELNKRYPGKIRKFYFVSNTNYLDTDSVKNKHLSPIKLITVVDGLSSYGGLKGEALKGFTLISDSIGVEKKELFKVLKQLDFVLGPTERACEVEIAQRHVPNLPDASDLSSRELSKISDSLNLRVSSAASLSTDNPSRDWVGLTKEAEKNPYLLAKRVTRDDILLVVRDALTTYSYFPIDLVSIDLPNVRKKLGVLEKKMVRGGLGMNYEMMRRRSILAEQSLLELATRGDNASTKKLSQIENVVLGECDDAYLRASNTTKDKYYGPPMLINIQDRLKNIAENSPNKAGNASYDILIGVSALLTSECKVWWSEHFHLDDSE